MRLRSEQAAFLAAHPDLYHRSGDVVRLTIRDGRMALGSLNRIGFATSATPDFATMRPDARTAAVTGLISTHQIR